ncbi:MAG: hypothetical protein AB4040_08515 [Synechococcus sp.]
MSEENTNSSPESKQVPESLKPTVGVRKGLVIPESKTFIGNRPIASNQPEGDDALMGYLD